jgi:hypothetical protein
LGKGGAVPFLPFRGLLWLLFVLMGMDSSLLLVMLQKSDRALKLLIV